MSQPPPEQIGEHKLVPKTYRCVCDYSGELWTDENDHREYEYRVLVDQKTGKHLAHKLFPKRSIL